MDAATKLTNAWTNKDDGLCVFPVNTIAEIIAERVATETFKGQFDTETVKAVFEQHPGYFEYDEPYLLIRDAAKNAAGLSIDAHPCAPQPQDRAKLKTQTEAIIGDIVAIAAEELGGHVDLEQSPEEVSINLEQSIRSFLLDEKYSNDMLSHCLESAVMGVEIDEAAQIRLSEVAQDTSEGYQWRPEDIEPQIMAHEG